MAKNERARENVRSVANQVTTKSLHFLSMHQNRSTSQPHLARSTPAEIKSIPKPIRVRDPKKTSSNIQASHLAVYLNKQKKNQKPIYHIQTLPSSESQDIRKHSVEQSAHYSSRISTVKSEPQMRGTCKYTALNKTRTAVRTTKTVHSNPPEKYRNLQYHYVPFRWANSVLTFER